MKDPMKLGLPKWPQMRVTGIPVTPERAKEIIRRTDQFFSYPSYAGNDKDWRDCVCRVLRIPLEGDDDKNWATRHKELDAWKKKWGYLETAYVRNDWIASSFAGGPHGWCSPEGVIGFIHNVGKWPRVEDLLKDWAKLAKAFPFLDLGATFMSGESCEDDLQPIVSIRVKRGTALLTDPATTNVHESHPVLDLTDPEFDLCNRVECGIPKYWITDWGRGRQ